MIEYKFAMPIQCRAMTNCWSPVGKDLDSLKIFNHEINCAIKKLSTYRTRFHNLQSLIAKRHCWPTNRRAAQSLNDRSTFRFGWIYVERSCAGKCRWRCRVIRSPLVDRSVRIWLFEWLLAHRYIATTALATSYQTPTTFQRQFRPAPIHHRA